MRSLSVFYILVLYVMLQFCWWAYLLAEQNKEIFDYQLQLAQASHMPVNRTMLEQHLHAKWWMISGEGLVFILLLSLGAYITRSSFKKEVVLNRLQQNFLLAVTHEFKSPLAAIKLYLQTLQHRDLEKAVQNSLMAKAIEDTNRMDRLIENVLSAGNIENTGLSFNRRTENLSEYLANYIASSAQASLLRSDITPNLVFNFDPIAFESLLSNLIENAVKYSPLHSEIFIRLAMEQKSLLLSIADQGPGIPDLEKKRVFERFYRIGNEQTRIAKGTGLGLFIVQHIVKGHNGSIAIRDNSPKGSIFEMRFPLV